jgi:hypothetical protein
LAEGDAVAPGREKARESLRTPKAAAIAGIVFALLLGIALVLMRVAVPSDPNDAGAWLDDTWHRDAAVIALNLVPYSGLAFLWFVGVVRDRIGDAEDRFFATVFLGTALLFVAMLFVTGAVAGGLIAAEGGRGTDGVSPEVWRYGRHVSYLVLTVYAMRMAGAFAIVTTTIAVRLGLLPRWLAIFGWAVGAVLLVTVQSFAWLELLFPVWVFALSLNFLQHPTLNRPGEALQSEAV